MENIWARRERQLSFRIGKLSCMKIVIECLMLSNVQRHIWTSTLNFLKRKSYKYLFKPFQVRNHINDFWLQTFTWTEIWQYCGLVSAEDTNLFSGLPSTIYKWYFTLFKLVQVCWLIIKYRQCAFLFFHLWSGPSPTLSKPWSRHYRKMCNFHEAMYFREIGWAPAFLFFCKSSIVITLPAVIHGHDIVSQPRLIHGWSGNLRNHILLTFLDR